MSAPTLANPDCYGCKGTGKVQGFGHIVDPCLCIAHCEDCDEGIVWDEYVHGADGRPPRRCQKCEATP